MKKLNVVRGVVFLTMLLANADVAETKMMVDRATSGPRAKCERCGQTGPTVPIAPVVFRAVSAAGFDVRESTGHASLGTPVRNARATWAVTVYDEFLLDSARPAVGAAVTR